jgi:hypothetical protein
MRKSRRLVVPLAVTALVAAGGVGMGLALTANAQTSITSCPSSTTAPITCTITNETVDTTVNNPSTIQAVVALTGSSSSTSTTSDLYIELQYSVLCFDSNGDEESTSAPASPLDEYAISSTVTENLTLGYTNPASCEVISLTGTLQTLSGTTYSNATAGSFTMTLEWTPQASTTATATTTTSTSSSTYVSYISGYDGKCIDDKGNSSSNGAKVIIWGCNHGDSAQGWSFSGGELKHNGKCANDAGNGGSGSHVILWSCNGASNEKWFHSSSNGEFILSLSSHGLLCLNDPGYSKNNGTQLIVYKCNNGSNEHWS